MDIFKFLQAKLQQQPQTVTQTQMKAAQGSKEQMELLSKFGVVTDDLRAALSNSDMINFERSSLYTSIDRSLVHPIMSGAAGIFSDVACLTANTEIPLLDGRVLTIEKLLCEYNEGKENWVYSCDTKGSPKAEKINWVVKQPNKKETLRVHLDNGKFIEASTNHEFIKRTGELCRTDELKVNDSLLPFHSGHSNRLRGKNYNPSASYNHKIVKIENIGEQEVYDLNINGSHLFALDCGVYVHNSSYNRVHNSTVWVTAKNKEYQYQIEKLFEIVNLEENIYDLCWSTATFGDLFWRIFAEPGLGIVSIDDTAHPITTSRIDYNGKLIGFFQTPGGYASQADRKLEAPWDYVHFRLLGAKRRRPQNGGADSNFSEYRTVSIMAPDVRRLTSKYGSSVLADGLPIFKRLRLAEDSILMARITRGVLRNIWKIGISKENGNNEAVNSIIDGYISTLKEARSLNIDINNPSYNSKFNAMANIEDIIIPVWGDVNQVDCTKIGGDVDIKWIEDVDLLTKQLSTALAIPLPLLAGYAQEANGGIGQNSLEKLDIRFARQARRVQRAVIAGLTRLAQIHLAYQGINPDPNFFTIHMSETSTAEELELQDALDKGLDVTSKAMDMFERVLGPDLDKVAAMEYLNEKFLKLSDLELDKIMLKGNANAFNVPAGEDTLGGGGSAGGSSSFGSAPATGSDSGNPFAEHMPAGEDVAGSTEEPSTKPEEGEPNKGEQVSAEDKEEENPFHENLNISDIHSAVPLRESIEAWTKQWGATKVTISPVKK